MQYIINIVRPISNYHYSLVLFVLRLHKRARNLEDISGFQHIPF